MNKYKKYKYAIFDLDGTLLNTLEDLKNSVNYSLKHFSMPEKTTEEIRLFLGNGAVSLFERSVPNGKYNPLFNDALNLFKEHYSKNNDIFTKPYDGIEHVLKCLKEKNIKSVIVSNKFDEAVKILADKYFSGLIDIAIGENEKCGIKRKPHPDMVLKAINDLKADKNDCVYIGDSEVDIATARASGINSIIVSWGFRDKEYLLKSGAKTIISKPLELLDYF